jgi:hypothetical protein
MLIANINCIIAILYAHWYKIINIKQSGMVNNFTMPLKSFLLVNQALTAQVSCT